MALSNEQQMTHIILLSFLKVLIILSMGVLIVSWLPRWLLYEPLANHLRRTRSLKWTQEKAERFSQSVAACSFHIIMAVFAWSVLKRKDWLYDKGAWVENLHGDNLIEPDFKFYYLLYAARYVSDLVSMHYEHKTKVSKHRSNQNINFLSS